MEIVSYILGEKSSSGITPTGTINITQNGETDVSSYATANVSVSPDLESKSVTITTNTTTTIEPSEGKDGLSSVEVITNVPQPSGTINITENGTYNINDYASASVNVAGATTPTTMQELTSSFNNAVNSFGKYYLDMNNEYYTQNPVTLYTPNVNAKYYCIQKRSSGKYRILWSNFGQMTVSNGITLVTISHNVSLGDLNCIYDYKDKLILGTAYNITAYTSNEFNSIEECIQKIQDSTTTYSMYTTASFGAVDDTPYKTPYSTIISFSPGATRTNADISKRISPNETIQVIS